MAELKDGEVREYRINPGQFGIAEHDGALLKAQTREMSQAILQRVLANEPGPARDIVLMNAGAALCAADVASSLAEGIERAREALASGRAADKLAQFVQVTQRLAAAQG